MRLVIALALAAAACSTPPANTHDFFQQAGQIGCEALFRCCSAQQAMTKSGVADAAHCSLSNIGPLNSYAAAFQTGIDKGLYTFDGVAAAVCLDGLRGGASSCGAPIYSLSGANDAICAAAFLGTIAPGKSCDPLNSGGGCQLGSYCEPLGRVCKLSAKLGEDCSTTACGAGLRCLAGNKCGAPLDDGASCAANTQCKSGVCGGTCAPSKTVAQTICG